MFLSGQKFKFFVIILITHTYGTIFIGMNMWCFPFFVVVAQLPSHVWLCDSMDCSTPGLPVPRHLSEFGQVRVHCISDAVQPSHLLTPSSSALDLSQHQGLFQWVFCVHQITKTLKLQFQNVLPVNIQGWSPLRLTSLISLLSKGFSRVFSSTTLWRHQFFGVLAFFTAQLSQPYVTTEKTIVLTIWTFAGRVMSLLFNILSWFVIPLLPRNSRLLISWLQSRSAVILEPKRRKSVIISTLSPSICHAVMGPDAMILVFLIFSLKPALSLSSFTLIKKLFSSSLLSAIRVVSSAYLKLLMFLLPVLIPVCKSSSPAFLMMCLAYRLNK